jgi:hypothetical protein
MLQFLVHQASKHTTLIVGRFGYAFLLLFFFVSAAFSQHSNIQVTTGLTSGGSWTVSGSGTSTLHTFRPSSDNANINVLEITNRLQGLSGSTKGSVKILTTNATGGTQVGNVNFGSQVTAANSGTSRYSLEVTAGGDIVVNSGMSLRGDTWNEPLNYGYDVSFSAVGNVLLNGSLSTSGMSIASTNNQIKSNGGNVLISAGGYVKVGVSITSNGGTNGGANVTKVGNSGGNVSITGLGGVTLLGNITSWNGYEGTLNYGGNGSITINSGNPSMSSGGGTGVNDGQVSGLLQGGDFVKGGVGIFRMNGSNPYRGKTTVSAGVLRLGSANSVPVVSDLVLAGGGLQSEGFSNTFASITLTANATLRLSAGVHTLTFTNLGSFAFGRILMIEDWQGTYSSPGSLGTAGKMVFNSTLSTSNLGQLKFKNSSTGNIHSSIQLGSKEIVAGDQ